MTPPSLGRSFSVSAVSAVSAAVDTIRSYPVLEKVLDALRFQELATDLTAANKEQILLCARDIAEHEARGVRVILCCGSAEKFFSATTESLVGEFMESAVQAGPTLFVTGGNGGSGAHGTVGRFCATNEERGARNEERGTKRRDPLHDRTTGSAGDMKVSLIQQGIPHTQYEVNEASQGGRTRQVIMSVLCALFGAELWTLEGGPGTANEVRAFTRVAGFKRWTKAINSQFLLSCFGCPVTDDALKAHGAELLASLASLASQ